MTYILAEADFKIIAYMNLVALAFFSLASLSFSIFLSFVTGWLFSPQLETATKLVVTVVTYASGGVAIIALTIAVIAVVRRKTHVQQIKNETVVK